MWNEKMFQKMKHLCVPCWKCTGVRQTLDWTVREQFPLCGSRKWEGVWGAQHIPRWRHIEHVCEELSRSGSWRRGPGASKKTWKNAISWKITEATKEPWGKLSDSIRRISFEDSRMLSFLRVFYWPSLRESSWEVLTHYRGCNPTCKPRTPGMWLQERESHPTHTQFRKDLSLNVLRSSAGAAVYNDLALS